MEQLVSTLDGFVWAFVVCGGLSTKWLSSQQGNPVMSLLAGGWSVSRGLLGGLSLGWAKEMWAEGSAQLCVGSRVEACAPKRGP